MMRSDSVGLFWEDLPTVRSRSAANRVRGPMPPIPHTGWTPPSEFPNLSAAKVIGFDTETYDPNLLTHGAGWARGQGHIIGASIAVPGKAWYFPIRHGIEGDRQVMPEHEAAMNMDPNNVLRYLQHVLGDSRPKVGANLIYDVGWLMQEGVTVGGKLYDVQFAEALLNSEAPDVTLDGLSERYLNRGKETSILYDWLAQWLGGAANDRQRKNLYLSPPSVAGPYAEADAWLPISILEKQWPLMADRGVLELFDLECRLIPLLVKMRFRGAPVSVDKAERLYETLDAQVQQYEKDLINIAGQPVNPAASASVGSAFERLGIPAPKVVDKKTGKEKVSYAANLIESIDHPLTAKILEWRRATKVKDTFVKGYILDKNVNGRLHCSFHPLRGDGTGARSGRFSSSDPNLQNIPVRTEIGRMVRDVFVAQGRWRKWDYSQIEYRLLAHHAVGPGADELRAAFNNNPDVDYHELVGELIQRLTGIELPRRNVKNINFGLIYGMSQPKLVRDLGLTPAKGAELFNNYHKAAPFARETMKAAAQEVNATGMVRTLLGRCSDFNRWGPKEYQEGQSSYSYEYAVRRWGVYNIQRSFTHKALNRRLQGGAADVMKKAMVDAYEAGMFADDACGMPLLTVHDELDFDDTNDLDNPAWEEFRHIMENAVATRVPVRIDMSVGPTWGTAD